MITIILPFPNSALNPNSSHGKHWSATAALRKSARHEAFVITRSAHKMIGSDEPVPLTITFVQPDKRQRDRDNLLAALKPSLDGIADALRINDAQFEPVTIRRLYGAAPGYVLIEIKESHE